MKNFIIVLVIIGVLIGGFFALNSYIHNEKQADKELTQEQEQALVSAYINENISILSPEPAVLGGTFYVTNIEFTNGNRGTVEYEDGHIALIADFEYFIDEGGVTGVDLTNVREPQF